MVITKKIATRIPAKKGRLYKQNIWLSIICPVEFPLGNSIFRFVATGRGVSVGATAISEALFSGSKKL